MMFPIFLTLIVPQILVSTSHTHFPSQRMLTHPLPSTSIPPFISMPEAFCLRLMNFEPFVSVKTIGGFWNMAQCRGSWLWNSHSWIQPHFQGQISAQGRGSNIYLWCYCFQTPCISSPWVWTRSVRVSFRSSTVISECHFSPYCSPPKCWHWVLVQVSQCSFYALAPDLSIYEDSNIDVSSTVTTSKLGQRLLQDFPLASSSDEYWTKWSQIFMSAMHRCILCKTVPIKSNTPWINHKIRSLLRLLCTSCSYWASFFIICFSIKKKGKRPP